MKELRVPDQTPPARSLPYGEFVALIASMLALTALSIDIMLPAFVDVGRHFAIAEPNQLQLMIFAYLAGFAPMQLVYGPLADSLGRRPLLLIGLATYCLGSFVSLWAPDFSTLLLARVLQGAGGAAARVLAVTIVRDHHSGPQMSRVMSTAMTVFIVVPVVAPAIGGVLTSLGGWSANFLFMLLAGLTVMIWFTWRMPETLKPEYRRALSFRSTLEGFGMAVRSRQTLGYATAAGLLLGCLMGYIGSSAQIFAGLYHLGATFPLVFAAIAGVMGLASFANARLVVRLGTQRMALGGVLLFVLAGAAQTAAAVAFNGLPPLWLLCVLLAANQFLFSLIVPNFNAMALEKMAHVAGAASSFVGFYTMLIGGSMGALIGQFFDGTVRPLSLGYLGLGLASALIALWIRNGTGRAA